MRQSRIALITAIVALLTLAPAGRAVAGGPTSVLLAAHDTGRAASLYYTDSRYERLARLVDVWRQAHPAEAGETDGRRDEGHQVGSAITLTWLIHDVVVWRVDRIYLAAPGGPWIGTQMVAEDTASIWDIPIDWHTANNGKQLTSLLEELGLTAGLVQEHVPGQDVLPPGPQSEDVINAPAVAGGAAQRPAEPVGREAFNPLSWLWVFIGVVGAGSLALVGWWWRSRRRSVNGATPYAPVDGDATSFDRDDGWVEPSGREADVDAVGSGVARAPS